MRIRIDENPPYGLVEELTALGHDVDHASALPVSGSDDPELVRATFAVDRMLITQDVGIADARLLSATAHAGLVLARMDNADWIALMMRLRDVFEHHDVESWRGCIVVITDETVRIRR